MIQRRAISNPPPPRAPLGGLMRLGGLLVALAVLAVTAVIVAQAFQAGRATAAARLQAIAELKAYQIGDWLKERREDAEFIQSSAYYAEQYRHWKEEASLDSRERLLVRLERFVQKHGFNAVTLLDPEGRVLWRTSAAPLELAPAVRAAALSASRGHEVKRVGPYQGENAIMQLDYLAPLDRARPAPVVVLHTSLTGWLYPRLLAWPVPSPSGEALLFRQDDDGNVHFLNALREHPGMAVERSLPLTRPKLLAAQVLRGDVALGALIEGEDYRGVPALGAAESIPESDWRLIAKLDRSEVDAPARRQSVWIGLTGLALALGAWLGVRQRRRAQSLLRESEQRFRGLAESLQDVVWLSDPSLTAIDYVNGAYEHIWGRSRESLYADPRSFLEAVHPDDRERVQAALARHARGESDLEYRLLRPDGEVRWILDKAAPIRDAAGRLRQMAGTASDITARKEAELAMQRLNETLEARVAERTAELQRSEERLRIIAASAHDAIITLDEQGNIELWNAAAERIFGYSREQALGRNLHELLAPPSAQPAHRRVFPHFLATGDGEAVGHTVELNGVHRDGHRVPLELSLSAAQVRGAWHAIGVVRDISDRKAAEDALRASEARARAIIDTSPMPFAINEAPDRITYLNPAFIRTFGYSLEDIPTLEHWWALAYPDPDYRERISETWLARLEQSASTGEPFVPLEARVRAKDGRTITILGSASQLSQSGGEQYLVSLYDVTEIQSAREQAEQAARAKSAFLAHMSHEIRTPMNGILGLAEIALHERLEPEVREDLDQIRQSAHSLLGILNDVLDQAKIDAGELRLEHVLFDLDALLETLRRLFGEAAAAKGLALTIRADAAVPRVLRGDALRLQQVLSNLLSNAVKFTEEGEVGLQVRLLEDDGRRVWLRWSVEDTGIGIDAATMARLFRPFSQGDDSIARRFGGTGLGLSISWHLVELMGGHLEPASKPGQGSRFAFDLRLERGPEIPKATETAPACAVSLQAARVLVAEDQPINQRVISDMLRLLGATHTLAQNGEEVLTRLAEADYDLVLMDIQMPGMDGLTATQHIRNHPEWGEIPVIALTAGVTEGERVRIRAAGLSDLLPKPVTLDALRATLARWLPGRADARLPEAAPTPPGSAGPADALSLPGFDLRPLLPYSGSAAALTERLREFAETVRDDAETIAASLASDARAEAASALHRLKGLAGTMGATGLFEAACALEAVLQAGGDPEPALAGLRQAHAAALEQVDTLPTPAEPAPMPQEVLAPAAVRALGREIRGRLREELFVSPDLLDALAAALSGAERAWLQDAKPLIDQLDYRSADRRLEPLWSALDTNEEP